jgi:Tol biopolymer transport system component
VFVVRRDGSDLRQLSSLGYETIAGWSPDGSELYYAIPDAGGEGWLLKAAAVETGVTRDLFVLKDASRKAPTPALSPDGMWIAYRAADLASLYLAGMDGSPARLVLDQPATAISGIVWEKEGHLLGVSLITPETPDGEVILLQIDNCEAYRLPGMHGELDGIILP